MMLHFLLSISLLYSSCIFASEDFLNVNNKELIAFKSPFPKSKKRGKRRYRKGARTPASRRSLTLRGAKETYGKNVKSCVDKFIIGQGYGIPLLKLNMKYGKCRDCIWRIEEIPSLRRETIKQKVQRDCKSRIHALKKVNIRNFYMDMEIRILNFLSLDFQV